MTPRFSIIIPTYNAVDDVAGTIESILAQRAGLAEIVVVDGGSTDGTLDVLAEYAGRVRSISEPDRGLYDAMNKGVGLSRGRFLNFQGAGDALRPGVLDIVTGRLPNDTASTIAYGKVNIVSECRIEGERFTRMTLRNGNIPHQAMFYSRDIFDTFGGYDLDYPVLADYVYCLRLFSSDAVEKVFIDEVIADYQGGGISTQRRDDRFYRDQARLIRENLGARPYWAWRLQNLVPLELRRRLASMRRAGVDRPIS